MAVALVSVVAFLPGVLWLMLICRSDRYDPEPTKLIVRTFLTGVILGIAFGLGYRGIPFIRNAILTAVLVAPIIEEGAKFLLVRWTVYESVEFDEPLDGVVYACSAALGFAAVENVAYVLDAWYSILPGAGILVLLGRAVLSVPGHALFSSIWGAALGHYRFGGKRKGKGRLLVGGLLLAMAAHAGFNLLAHYEPLGGLGLLILLGLMWRFLYISSIGRALRASPFREEGRGESTAEPSGTPEE